MTAPTRAMPAWAVEPLDKAGAARALGISIRTLVDLVRDHPHYEPRGNRKVFYPEHIAALRDRNSLRVLRFRFPPPMGAGCRTMREHAHLCGTLLTQQFAACSAPPPRRSGDD